MRNKLVNMIIIISILLAVCVAVDYATNVSNNATKIRTNDTDKVFLIDENESNIVVKSSDPVHQVEPVVPKITITSKPSCGCNHGYYWHTKTFVNYCPNCGRYNVLANVHKYQARYEQELTCSHCGSDYCGCCGKEKYNKSRVYLRSV